ncbi:MAG: hypothetical protein ACRELB_22640, partial [Polyangiaceae bacterium]
MARRGHVPCSRRVLCALAAAVALLWPAIASASLTMSWDCYLPNASVDCVVLRSSLTSKIPFLEVVPDVRSAEVAVSVTSVPAEDGTRYKLDFVGKRVDGFVTEVHLTDRI